MDNQCIADQQPGSDMGAKILACQSSLPSTGGIIDERGLIGAQNWNTATIISKSNLTILLGEVTAKITTPIIVSGLSVTIEGNGHDQVDAPGGGAYGTNLQFWGVPGIQTATAASSFTISDLALNSYTSSGVANPATQIGIELQGTWKIPSYNFHARHISMYGWGTAIKEEYEWNSVLDAVYIMAVANGIEYFGQCVNNMIHDSQIVGLSTTANTQYGLHLVRDDSKDTNGANFGQGLSIANSMIFGFQYDIYGSDPTWPVFSALEFSNGYLDAAGVDAVYSLNTAEWTFSNSYLYSGSSSPVIEIMSPVGQRVENLSFDTDSIISGGGGVGVDIKPNVQDVRIVNSSISVNRAYGVYAALGTTYVTVEGNSFIGFPNNAGNNLGVYLGGQYATVVNNYGDNVTSSGYRGSYFNNISGADGVITHCTSTSPVGKWIVGDFCINKSPTIGGAAGWLNVAGGNPGTWGEIPLGDKSNNFQFNSLLAGGGTTRRAIVDVRGTVAWPNTTGVPMAQIMSLGSSTDSYAGGQLDFGLAGSKPYGAWIQSEDSMSAVTTQPLAINPNGGPVFVGTVPTGAPYPLIVNGTIANNNGPLLGGFLKGAHGTSANSVDVQYSDGTGANVLAAYKADGTLTSGPAIPIFGISTLVGGTVKVDNAAACRPSASCSYSLTRCVSNSSTAVGVPTVDTVIAGKSFVISSLSSINRIVTGDLASVCWRIN